MTATARIRNRLGSQPAGSRMVGHLEVKPIRVVAKRRVAQSVRRQRWVRCLQRPNAMAFPVERELAILADHQHLAELRRADGSRLAFALQNWGKRPATNRPRSGRFQRTEILGQNWKI